MILEEKNIIQKVSWKLTGLVRGTVMWPGHETLSCSYNSNGGRTRVVSGRGPKSLSSWQMPE